MTDEESREELGSAASLLEGLAEAPGLAGGGPLMPGQLVGDKFRVERAIGQGGMGVVYLARDLRLGRDVALKLGTHVSTRALARLEREAQALAKLSHPNVVVIHEVGEVDGRLFVAMEHVPGGTARAWAKTAERTTAEIVALYAAAGDGLAAAHAAGIIHRDFKPDNVLVGDDGRPRVADFGLSRALDETVSLDPDAAGAAVTSSPALTRTAGTPAYMAPEQRNGGTVDARADQFAFCASVWEALFGVRPSEGRARIQRRVPGHVVAALERGLHHHAGARWPAMAALVAELRHDPGARRRRLAVAGLAVVAVGSAVVIPVVARRGEDPCGGGAQRIAGAWGAARAQTVEHALGASLFPGVRDALDGYAARWVDAERAACRATRVEGTQSEAMLDRRVLCLQRARARLDAVVSSLATGGGPAVEHAADQLGLLPELAACADVATLGTQAALPADPARRATIATVTDQLAGARSQLILSEPTAVGALDHLVELARTTGWPPLVAEALYVRALGRVQAGQVEPARSALEEAAAAALAAANDETAAYAMADLAWDLAAAGANVDAARWAVLAEALRTRAGGDPALGARIAGARAIALAQGDHPAEALAMRQRQVELARQAFHDPVNEAANHLSLAIGYHAAGQAAEAQREVETGLSQAEAVLGTAHPKLLGYLQAAAQYAIERGKLDAAEPYARRAVAIAEHAYGQDSRQLAPLLIALAGLQQQRGDLRGARETSTRALAIMERTDPSAVDTGGLEMNLGMYAAQLGDLDEATRRAGRALAIFEPRWGKTSPKLISLLILQGYVARERGQLDASAAALERAVALADAAGGSADPVNPRIELSYTLVKLRRARQAVELLVPMLEVAARGDTPPPAVAELHLALAAALWDAGERARARAEAAASRDAWAALGDGFHGPRDQAAAWLAAHP